MRLNLSETVDVIKKNGLLMSGNGEKESVLSEVLSSLTDAVSVLQNAKELETRLLFGDLEKSFPEDGIDFHETKRQFEICLVRQALRRTNGSQTKAAKLLKIKPTTLNAIVKRHHINVKIF